MVTTTTVEELAAADVVELAHPLDGEWETFKVWGAYGIIGGHVELMVQRLHRGQLVGGQYRRWIREGSAVRKVSGWLA